MTPREEKNAFGPPRLNGPPSSRWLVAKDEDIIRIEMLKLALLAHLPDLSPRILYMYTTSARFVAISTWLAKFYPNRYIEWKTHGEPLHGRKPYTLYHCDAKLVTNGIAMHHLFHDKVPRQLCISDFSNSTTPAVFGICSDWKHFGVASSDSRWILTSYAESIPIGSKLFLVDTAESPKIYLGSPYCAIYRPRPADIVAQAWGESGAKFTIISKSWIPPTSVDPQDSDLLHLIRGVGRHKPNVKDLSALVEDLWRAGAVKSEATLTEITRSVGIRIGKLKSLGWIEFTADKYYRLTKAGIEILESFE